MKKLKKIKSSQQPKETSAINTIQQQLIARHVDAMREISRLKEEVRRLKLTKTYQLTLSESLTAVSE